MITDVTYRENKARRRRGFTLTELLVVIGIIGLMMALVLPAFTGLGRGAGMNSALLQLKTTASLARQWAITKRVDVYLVFAADDFNYGGSLTGHVDKCFRAYNVYTAQDGYLRDWTYLPQGVVFVKDFAVFSGENPAWVSANNCLLSNNGSAAVVASKKISLPFPDSNSPVQQLRGLVFRSTGIVAPGGNPNSLGWDPEIYLSEAAYTVQSPLPVVTPKPFASRMMFSLQFYRFAGQPRIRDYRG